MDKFMGLTPEQRKKRIELQSHMEIHWQVLEVLQRLSYERPS